jgi:hypothetical protein
MIVNVSASSQQLTQNWLSKGVGIAPVGESVARQLAAGRNPAEPFDIGNKYVG